MADETEEEKVARRSKSHAKKQSEKNGKKATPKGDLISTGSSSKPSKAVVVPTKPKSTTSTPEGFFSSI